MTIYALLHYDRHSDARKSTAFNRKADAIRALRAWADKRSAPVVQGGWHDGVVVYAYCEYQTAWVEEIEVEP